MRNGPKLGPWIAVIATATSALTAYVLAQRYEQLTVSYRATAESLESILSWWSASQASLGELVEQCEAVLLEENQGWIAGVDKDAGNGDDHAASRPHAAGEPARAPIEPIVPRQDAGPHS